MIATLQKEAISSIRRKYTWKYVWLMKHKILSQAKLALYPRMFIWLLRPSVDSLTLSQNREEFPLCYIWEIFINLVFESLLSRRVIRKSGPSETGSSNDVTNIFRLKSVRHQHQVRLPNCWFYNGVGNSSCFKCFTAFKYHFLQCLLIHTSSPILQFIYLAPRLSCW